VALWNGLAISGQASARGRGDGRGEFVNRSLRTSDYRQAVRQARIVAFEVEWMFQGKYVPEAWQPEHFHPAPKPAAALVRRYETAAPLQEAAAPPQPVTPIRPFHSVLTLTEVYDRYINGPAAERSAKTLLTYPALFARRSGL